MTPTRELALQITKECKKFSKPLGLRVVCVYGGTGISEQVNAGLQDCPKCDSSRTIHGLSVQTSVLLHIIALTSWSFFKK